MFGFLDTKKKKFLAAMGLQLAVIFLMIIYKTAILIGGQIVYLRIAPVDPRDPLRGDYVVFQLQDFSRLDAYIFDSPQSVKSGDVIFVTVGERGDYAYPIGASKTKPSGDDIFIKGTVTNVSSQGNFNSGLPEEKFVRQRIQDFNIKYGIEEYFIKEGSGRNVSFRGYANYAQVMVDNNGSSLLKRLFIDGKPWP